MTTNPETGINPRIAAKIDAEKARYKPIMETRGDECEREDIAEPVLDRVFKLENQLARVAATNLEGLKFKARCLCFDGAHYDPSYEQDITQSIVRWRGFARKLTPVKVSVAELVKSGTDTLPREKSVCVTMY